MIRSEQYLEGFDDGDGFRPFSSPFFFRGCVVMMR